ncbi:hypothetical protein KR018_008080 [Drosophila ironensis]|nr:hypothetical protein KR018_008080 [Drosophila ironensis]
MSWLNSSLSSLKGQLTNLAQEVLAETAGPGDPEFQGPEERTKTALELLEATQQQKEHLDRQCELKNREVGVCCWVSSIPAKHLFFCLPQIAALRREIVKIKASSEAGAGAAKSSPSSPRSASQQGDQNEEPNVEDSWCWEPLGPATKGPDSGLVDVALGAGDVTHLNSRIAELEQLNGQLNASLEELDAQHDVAMRDVLEHKKQLSDQLAQLQQLQADRLVEYELANAVQQGELENLRGAATAARQLQEQLEQKVSQQEAELRRGVNELAELQALLEKRGQDNSELIERVRLAEAEREKLEKDLEELRLAKEKKTSESSSNSSSIGKHSEDEFIVVRQGDGEPDAEGTPPPSKEKLRDRLVSLEAQISELTLTNSQLQDGQLEKQLSINLLGEQLVELEKRLRLSEAEKEQLQLDLQLRLQQLTVQNQELKLHAEAEQEGHAQDLEEQLSGLREDNSRLRQELDANIAQAKFRQAIAEEKQEITDLDEAEAAEEGAFELEKLRSLLQAQLEDRLEGSQPQQSLERAWHALRERWHRLDIVEQRLVELQDQQLVSEHEKKTLEADISQYILQCDELMKNNELLLNELDKFKRNKLETIEEHHEETIVQLESALEDARQRLEVALEAQRELQEELAKDSPDTELLGQREAEKEQLEQLLSSANQKLEKTEARNQVFEQLLAATKLDQEQQAHQLAEVQRQLADGEKERLGHQEITVEHEKLRLEHQALKEKLLAVQDDLEARNQQQKVSEEQHKSHLEKLQENIKGDQDKLLALLHQQDKLEQQKELMEVEQNQQVSGLKKDLLTAEKQLAECQEQLSLKEAKLAELQQQLDETRQQEVANSQEELAKLREELVAKDAQLQSHQTADQQSLETLGHEKQELIKALQQKHLENTQYYAEIQRLQPFEAQIKELLKEREKLQDQIAFLKEKSDILTTNLLTEQTNQRLLQQQQAEIQELHTNGQRDLERLRAHLLEVEELHTQETVELQRQLEQARSRQAVLEHEVSKSSTAYTSASIRANQQAETLQAQHVLLLQQRDDLLTKLGQFEDRELKQQAALTNLQCALEQFQNDKEHDIELATQRIRREMQSQLSRQGQLQAEMGALQQQLADANQGLRAAARLSDQLEAGQQTIAVLREEVEVLKDANGQLEARLSSSESSQTDKIDKSLIKSLLIGYVVSGHAGDKQQVLRMISSVLDFSAQEADKVGLNKQQSSWLGSILGGGGESPKLITLLSTAGSSRGNNENLLQAFVQFLEQESQPQSQAQSRPNLLSLTGGAAPTDPAVAPSHPVHQASAPVPLATQDRSEEGGAEFAPTRNSSSILKDILSDS